MIFNWHEVKNIIQYCHFSEFDIILKLQIPSLFMWETVQNYKHVNREDWEPLVISHFGTTVVKFPSRNKMGVISKNQ